MNSLKDIRIDGLKELRENGLKRLKISSLKNLISRSENSRTEDISNAELEDMAKKREEIKKEIKKLNQEKKGIEAHIYLIQKAEKEKNEEVAEFPWREEIFPPLPRKKDVKMPETLEVKVNSLHAEDSGFSEVKDNGVKINVKKTNEKTEGNTLEEVSENKTLTTIQAMAINNVDSVNSAEVATPKNKTEKKDGEKTGPEKEEKTKTIYPFLEEKLNENKVPDRGSSNNSIEKKKIESKNSPAASILGENLIEELLSSDDLNPEEEQSFVKYLQEPEIGELINDLKDVRSLLARAEHAC